MLKPLEKGLLRAATQQAFHLSSSELTPSLTDGTHTEPRASAEYSAVIKSRGLRDKRNGRMKLGGNVCRGKQLARRSENKNS